MLPILPLALTGVGLSAGTYLISKLTLPKFKRQPLVEQWTVANPNLQSTADGPTLMTTVQQLQKRLASALGELEEKYHWFIKTRVDPLFQGKRHALMQELQAYDEEELKITPYERQMNRHLALSILLMVAAVTTVPLGGVVAFVACVPLAMYLIRDVYKGAYRTLKDEGRLTIPVLLAVNQTLLWFGATHR